MCARARARADTTRYSAISRFAIPPGDIAHSREIMYARDRKIVKHARLRWNMREGREKRSRREKKYRARSAIRHPGGECRDLNTRGRFCEDRRAKVARACLSTRSRLMQNVGIMCRPCVARARARLAAKKKKGKRTDRPTAADGIPVYHAIVRSDRAGIATINKNSLSLSLLTLIFPY